MTYDMRGNRESEGNIADFTRQDFINDAAVAYDFLKAQVGKDTKIGVVGSSFGGYTAVLLSEKRDVMWLSLRVPASYPDEGFTKPHLGQRDPDGFTAWRKQKLDHTQNAAFKALHDFGGHVQIIEAEKDELVPSQAPKNYANAITDKNKLRHDIMKGAPHRLDTPERQTEYEQLLTNWLQAIQQ
jgi:dienelactone hydrolase